MSSDSNNTLSTITTISATVSITPYFAPTPQPSVVDYVWNYTSHTIGPAICWIMAIVLATLFCYRRYPQLLVVDRLSPTVLLLFSNHLVNNAIFTFSDFIINFAVKYDPPRIDSNHWKDTWWRFWTNNYSITAPASVLFVTLDRLLVLKLAYRYGKEIQTGICYASMGTMAALYVFSLANVLIAWPYHDGETQTDRR